MPTIRIEDDVMNGLKKLAEPFVDTPSTVIRRLLEDKGILSKNQTSPSAQSEPLLRPSRASLTPQSTYEDFLLTTLEEKFGGRADKRDVTHEVVDRMTKRGFISSADLEIVATGETKAENTIAWGRNALKERGLISRISPRGVWELTEEGRAAARAVRLPGKKTG